MVRWVHEVDSLDLLKNLDLPGLDRGSVNKDLRLRGYLQSIWLKRHRHHGRCSLIRVLTRITILWKVGHLRYSTANSIRRQRHHRRSLQREVPVALSWHLVGILSSLVWRSSILSSTIALVAPIISTAPLSLQVIVVVLVSSISVTTRRLSPGKITRCVL